MRLVRKLRDQRGQTIVEYLVLTAMVIAVVYLMMNGQNSPFGRGVNMILGLVSGPLPGTVRYGAAGAGGNAGPGIANPTNPSRMKPLH